MELEGEGDEAVPRHNSVPNLPEELITVIIVKLPVESLLKLRCVSKSWLSLITSPEFVKYHLLLSAGDKDYTHHRVMFDSDLNDIKDCSLSTLLHDSVTDAFDLDYPGKCPKHYPGILDSSNGLICLATLIDQLLSFILWNPSIRKYKALPDYMLDHEDSYYFLGCGLAYDEPHDDYKVVCLFSCSVVKIYCAKSNSWRRIHGPQVWEVLNSYGKLLNRKLHWIVNDCDDLHIISFDFADETWAEVEILCCFKRDDDPTLGVFGGNLSLFYRGQDRVDFWVMKEYGVKESWTRMFTIKRDSPVHNFYPPIFISSEGEILLHGSRFTAYNPKDDSIRYLDVTNFTSCFGAVIYVKSLVLPF